MEEISSNIKFSNNNCSSINLTIKYPEENKIQSKTIKVFLNDLLEESCQQLFGRFDTKHTKHYYYIKKDNMKMEELPNKKIFELGLKEGDEIIISNIKNLSNKLLIMNKTEEEETSKLYRNLILKNTNKRSRNIKNYLTIRSQLTTTSKDITDEKKRSNRFLTILLYIIFTLIIGGLLFLTIYFLKPKKKGSPIELILKKDNLIINKQYPTNLYMRFLSRKHTSILAEGVGIDQEKANNNISQISDFIFVVRNNYSEIDIDNKIEKELYTAYIAFLNITLKNETDDMIMIYDKELNKYLNKQNQRRLEQVDDPYQTIIKEGIICFTKLEFYQNGEIKNYYIPNTISKNDFKIYIKEITKLIIPQISSNLYVKSINESIKEYFTSDNEDDNKNAKMRRLKQITKKLRRSLKYTKP